MLVFVVDVLQVRLHRGILLREVGQHLLGIRIGLSRQAIYVRPMVRLHPQTIERGPPAPELLL